MLQVFALIFLLFGCCACSWIHECPRLEDIHPCSCSNIHTRNPNVPDVVVVCQNIRTEQILKTTFHGMKKHSIDLLVFDNCKIPSFPNDLFKDINIRTVELLDSTVQLNSKFLKCINNC